MHSHSASHSPSHAASHGVPAATAHAVPTAAATTTAATMAAGERRWCKGKRRRERAYGEITKKLVAHLKNPPRLDRERLSLSLKE
jgi:hypothetical protein